MPHAAAAPPTPAQPVGVTAATPEITPGGVLADAWRMFREHAVVLGLVALLLDTPVLLALALGADGSRGFLALNALVGALLHAAVTSVALQAQRGERPRLAAALSQASRRIGGVAVVSFGGGLAVLLGLVLLVVPGVVLWGGLFVAVPVLLADPALTPSEALRRSWELTRGHRLTLVLAGAVTVLLVLAVSALGALLPQPEGGGAPGVAIAVASELLFLPALVLSDVLPAVAFHQLRVRKEGFAAAEVGRIFE